MMSAADPPPEPWRERPRRRRSPTRFLAPLALVAVVGMVVIVVSANTGSGGSSDTSSPLRVSSPASRPATQSGSRRSRTSGAGRRRIVTTESPGFSATTSATSASATGTSTTAAGTYTIAAGDTFAAVSAKTGVPIATIEKLNPGVSSSALTVGQVIKLK